MKYNIEEIKEVDLAWAAGLIDGEGCLSIHKKSPSPSRPLAKSHTYQARMHVKMTHLPTIQRFVDIFGFGSIYKEMPGKNNKKVAWKADFGAEQTEAALLAMMPYFVTKKEEAETLLAYITENRERSDFPKRLGVPKELVEMREEYYYKMRELKKCEWMERQ